MVIAKITVFKGKDGQWWTNLQTANSSIVFGSVEGYKDKRNAIRPAKSLFPNAKLVLLDESPAAPDA
jgi:uncharacterized protein YegP (UPF0339 family)